MSSGRWLVIGLGNPGPPYTGNRHNVGQMVLDVLASRAGGRFRSHRARADVVEARLARLPVALAKPHSFMNESGGPVGALRDFFKVDAARVVVVHDDLDLPFGALRVKRGGGDGGHNGLRSITRVLGADYARVRVGIGRPPGRMHPADFVLRDFSAAERKELPLVVERAADAVGAVVVDGLEAAQNAFNAPA